MSDSTPASVATILVLSNDGIDRLLADIARPTRNYLWSRQPSPAPH